MVEGAAQWLMSAPPPLLRYREILGGRGDSKGGGVAISTFNLLKTSPFI